MEGRSEKRKSQRKKKYQSAPKGREVAKRSVFPDLEVKMVKAPQRRNIFGAAPKVHAAVARSAVPSQDDKSTFRSRGIHWLKKCALVWREARFHVKR